MMIKRGNAKTGMVVEAASANEASICPFCGKILAGADDVERVCLGQSEVNEIVVSTGEDAESSD